MAATLKSEQLSRSIADGFVRYQYTRVYETQQTSLFDAINEPGIPALGSELIVSGVRTWCTSQIPARANDDTARSQMFVSCLFTNETQAFERTVNGQPTSDPADIAPLVQEQWDEFEEPVKNARLRYITDENGTVHGTHIFMSARVGSDWRGPIVNSSLEPQTGHSRRSHRLQVTYWTWHRTWDNDWDEYLDKVNSDTITVTQRDEDGIRSQRTFTAGQALCANVIREEHWRDAKLWFRRGIVMQIRDETWDLRLPDVGLTELIFVDQYKKSMWGGTDQYTETDLESAGLDDTNGDGYVNTPILKAPLSADGSSFDLSNLYAVSEPVKLNGYGREYHMQRPPTGPRTEDGQFILHYEIYETAAFAGLGIS